MINKCAERLKAWGRWYKEAQFEGMPRIIKDKIEKDLKDMEQQVFFVGREHSRKDGEFVYLKEPVGTRWNAAIFTTGIKAEAHRFTDPSEAQRSAHIANQYAPKEHQFTVGLPEQFRSDITASQREAHRQHKLEEPTPFAKFYASRTDEERCGGISDALDLSEPTKEQKIASTGVSTEEAHKYLEDIEEITGEKPKSNSIVERPAHYSQGAIDVIEALYQLLTWEQFKGFMQGNIVKYTVRFEDKDDPIIDLEKAEYYTKRLREYRMRHREAELADKAKEWGVK